MTSAGFRHGLWLVGVPPSIEPLIESILSQPPAPLPTESGELDSNHGIVGTCYQSGVDHHILMIAAMAACVQNASDASLDTLKGLSQRFPRARLQCYLDPLEEPACACLATYLVSLYTKTWYAGRAARRPGPDATIARVLGRMDCDGQAWALDTAFAWAAQLGMTDTLRALRHITRRPHRTTVLLARRRPCAGPLSRLPPEMIAMILKYI